MIQFTLRRIDLSGINHVFQCSLVSKDTGTTVIWAYYLRLGQSVELKPSSDGNDALRHGYTRGVTLFNRKGITGLADSEHVRG